MTDGPAERGVSAALLRRGERDPTGASDACKGVAERGERAPSQSLVARERCGVIN